jgi:hypothetical protein
MRRGSTVGALLCVSYVSYSDVELSRLITAACTFGIAAALSASYGPADCTDVQRRGWPPLLGKRLMTLFAAHGERVVFATELR